MTPGSTLEISAVRIPPSAPFNIIIMTYPAIIAANKEANRQLDIIRSRRSMKDKELIEHRDILGRVIKVGDIAVICRSGSLYNLRITKINPKKVAYGPVDPNGKVGYWDTGNVYPDMVVIVNEQREFNERLISGSDDVDDPNIFRVNM